MPIATLCRLSQCTSRHITRTRHQNRVSYRARRPCAPLANCDYRLLSPSTQDFRCCRTAYWPATQHSSASLLLVKYGNVSTVVLTSLELLSQHLVHIIPRELKLDKKIQNWVRASVCAVRSRQTVTQNDSIETLQHNRNHLAQKPGLSSLARDFRDPPSKIIEEVTS